MSAAARIEELKKRYEENPRRFFAPLANEYRKSGELEQAIALCEAHLHDQSTNMNGHIVYGQALFDAGKYSEARTTFEQALALDPENLIALRHLGDIARAHGETDVARRWYTRVLDADPRNSEIIVILGELKPAAAGPSRRQTPAAAQEVTAAPDFGRPLATTPVSAAPAVVPSAEVIRTDAPQPHDRDGLMDLDLDLGAVAEAPEEPGSSAAARGESGDIELMFGPDTSRSPTPAHSDADLSSAFGFGELDLPGPSEAALEAAPEAAPEPSIEYEPEMDSDAHQPQGAAPQAFVTETMAELYVQQGFHSEALAVYRQLLALRPDDDTLRERVLSLEASEASGHIAESTVGDTPSGAEEPAYADVAHHATPVASAEPVTAERMTAPAVAPFTPVPEGPPRTAREFFGRLAVRRASRTSARGTLAAGAEPAAHPMHGSSGTTGGSLDTLFAGGSVGAEDEHVALALSEVGPTAEPAYGIRGKPTQAATSELSLDAVFRDSPSREISGEPDQSAAVGFDQFFGAPRSDTPSPNANVKDGGAKPPLSEPGSAAELEQFQDWLQQLKKP